MAYATLAGYSVLEATLCVPRTGVWHVDVTLDADAATALAGRLALVIGDATWSCASFRGDAAEGRVEARLVGGAGGMSRALPGQSYYHASLRVVVADLLGGAGEALSPASDAALLATEFGAWSRRAGFAANQLGEALREAGGLWRVLPDGTVYVGPEDAYPPAATFDYDVLSRSPREGRLEIGGTENYKLLPGVSFEGGRVAYVAHELGADAIRTTVYFE